MSEKIRSYAVIGLYLFGIALLTALGLFIVQGDFTLQVKISLGVAVLGLSGFAIMNPERIREMIAGRQMRYGSNTVILLFAFIGILSIVNYLIHQKSIRWDLTEDKQYSLASETIATIEKLPQKVSAIGFFTARYPNDTAKGLLDQYEFYGGGKFDYQFIDPEQDPVSAKESKVTKDGSIVFKMGDIQEQVTYASEQEITSALIRLINPEGKRLYFLIGHGEREIQQGDQKSLSFVKDLLESKNYSVDGLNLVSSQEIPEDASVVIIPGPDIPLGEDEVTLLADYLDHGGSVILLQEPVLLTQSNTATDPFIEYLAQTWGIQVGEDIIIDLASNQPFYAVSNKYSDHAITQKMHNIITFFPTARSVTVDVPSPPFIREELVWTSEKSWAETDLKSLEANIEPALDNSQDMTGPVPLVASAENSETKTRLVVFGDVDFASNGFSQAYGNSDIFVNAVDWAANQEEIISLTPKQVTNRVIIPPKQFTMGLILLTSIFVIPGSVLIAGIIVWINRKRRG